MKTAVLTILLSMLFFSIADASMPVDVTITGCVKVGRLISSEIDFGTHKVTGRNNEIRVFERDKQMSLSEFEGKIINVRGYLAPADIFYTDKRSIRVIGVCNQTKLSLQDQQKLATQIFNQLRNTKEDDLDTFERLYKRVIEECPDTDKAKESYWRLTNLYLQVFNPPRYREAVKVLEDAIYKYPKDEVTPQLKNTLLFAYEKIGQWSKAVELYEEPLKSYPALLQDPRNAATMINYAEALYNSGNSQKAAEVLRRVVSFGNQIEDWMIDAAKEKLREVTSNVK